MKRNSIFYPIKYKHPHYTISGSSLILVLILSGILVTAHDEIVHLLGLTV